MVAETSASGMVPLSFGQQRLWFLDEFHPGGTEYITSTGFRLRGPLEPAALTQALNQLVARHESLRTTFGAVNGRGVQIVGPPFPVRLETKRAAPGPQFEHVLLEEVTRPFDLRHGPLFRALLVKLGEDDHGLVLCLHHIVTDGWSMGVLAYELGRLYSEAVNGEPAALPPLASRYADFAAWQRDTLSGPVLDEQIAYWERHLAGVPALELPADRPRPAIRTAAGATHRFLVPAPLSARLTELGRGAGTTLFTTLIAATQVFLARYTGQRDIAVGTVSSGRARGGLENLVGFFVNTVVIRGQVEGSLSFAEFLARTRPTVVAALAHEEVPFDRLVDLLVPERDASRSPLVQVMVVLQNAPSPLPAMAGLHVRHLDLPRRSAVFDLTLEFKPAGEGSVGRGAAGGAAAGDGSGGGGPAAGGLRGAVEYSTDLFDAATIERMSECLLVLLEAIADDPCRPLSQLPVLPAADTRRLLTDWNGPAQPEAGDCVHDAFAARVREQPQAIAVTCAGMSLTYRELDERANRLAHDLVARGAGPQARIAVCAHRGIDTIVAMLAVLKAGAAYVPLDPDYPPERLAFLIEDCGARLVLADGRFRDRLPASVSVADLRGDGSGGRARPPAVAVRPEDLACVMYTSGSSGQPKGVLIEHRCVTHLRGNQHIRLDVGDVVSQCGPLSFDASTFEIWGALLAGARLAIGPPGVLSAEEIREYIRANGLTTLWMTSGMFHEIATADPGVFHGLRRLLSGGDVLSPDHCARVLRRLPGLELINGYGPTENTVFASCHRFTSADLGTLGTSVPIGVPITGTRCYVLDRDMNLVPIGVPGELHVGGAGLARGYAGRPGLTAERFPADPFCPGARLYRTGDVVRWRADGLLDFIGRIDDQVKIRGFRIEVGEVESALRRHPAVTEAVVVARDDGTGHKRLIGYAVAGGATGPAVHADELRDFLQASLPAHLVPSAVVIVDELPLTANGKVDRKALPAPRTRAGQGYVAPRGPDEELLAGVWAQVLGVDRAGRDDNFFDLGGDSILSIQVVSRARQLGLRITSKDVFLRQTLAGLASSATREHAVSACQDPVSGPVPLSPIQRWFFETTTVDLGHFGQWVAMELAADIDRDALRAAIGALPRHHDALRMRFERTGDEWRQQNDDWRQRDGEAGPDGVLRLADPDIAPGPVVFRLDTGPLLNARLIETRPRPRLILTAHHLVVDGVSWRILLEDLRTAYRQAAAGQPVDLGPKTTSFRDWSQRLHDHVAAGGFDARLGYWASAVAGTASTGVPGAGEGAGEGAAAQRSVTAVLAAGDTGVLVRDASAAYRARVDDLLLSALVRVLCRWAGRDRIMTELEGHGREDIFDDIDLSRTVGWFTTLYPVELRIPDDGGWATVIKSVKEQLRAVPDRGLSYGALRYLPSASLADYRPLVSFNYLGRFDAGGDDPHIGAPSGVGLDKSASASASASSWLDVTAFVAAGGELEFEWTYSPRVHDEQSVTRLAEETISALREIAAHIGEPGSGGCTPSDFPLTALSQEELDRVAGDGRAVEDVYRLTPMQEGMLFHSLSGPGSYLEQVCFTLADVRDLRALEQRWQRAVDSIPVLRTAVIWEGLREPVQVVHRTATLPVVFYDWSGMAVPDQDEEMRQLLRDDRAAGLDLVSPPLMRITLIRLAGTAVRVLWTFHHLVLDGWSTFQVLSEILPGDVAPAPARRRPFRDYMNWLSEADEGEAEDHWRKVLAGFQSPTRLPFDRAPGQVHRTHSVATVDVMLPRDRSARLFAFARRHRLTVNAVLQGAWAILLGRHGGQRDVCFGAVVSGRPAELAGVDSIVGMFINTVPVRVRLDETGDIAGWLRRLQAQQIESRRFEHLSLTKVQRLSELPAGTSLFDSIIAFENYPLDAQSLAAEGFDVKNVSAVEVTNYPLRLIAIGGTKNSAELTFAIGYDPELFDQPTALAAELVDLLDELAGGRQPQANTAGPGAPEVDGTMAGTMAPEAAGTGTGDPVRRPYVPPRSPAEAALARIWADVLAVDRVGVDDDFFALGGDSILAIRVAARLREQFGASLPPRALFDSPTVGGLALMFEHPTVGAMTRLMDRGTGSARDYQLLQSGGYPLPGEDVAIIGAAVLLPQADGFDTLHDLLAEGRDTMRQPAAERLRAAGGSPGTSYLPMGYLDRIDLFDHKFFGISLREAEMMDPHQRLILQLAHEAIENAGYAPGALRGSRTAVLLGCPRSDYHELFLGFDFQQVLGTLGAAMAARISYVFGFTGAAFVVDTACSSSLVAIAQAAQALRDGNAELAIAGGISVRPILLQQQGHTLMRGVESTEGRCRPFDENATGATGGEGGGVVVLRLLSAALAAGDHVHAVLKGIAVNHNGRRIASMSAPSQVAQTEAITEAWADADVEARSIGYVECHGSATPLGDVVEVDALRRAFTDAGVVTPHCAIGSIKGNIGHLDNAAGVAGLLKVMLSVRRGMLYPTANFSSPNPLIDFSGPVQVNPAARQWPAGGAPRRAGVSSFGLTGTNAHAVIEEPPPVARESPRESSPEPGCELVTVSAKSASALLRYTSRLADFAERSEHGLAEIAHAMNRGRDDYPYRVAVTARSKGELAGALRSAVIPDTPAPDAPPVVLLFSGDGGIDAAAWGELSAAHAGLDPCPVRPGPDQDGVPGFLVAGSPGAGLVAVQYALYQLSRSLGVPDTHLVGSGAGNITLRVARGELSLADGLEAAAGVEVSAEIDRDGMRRAVSGFVSDGVVAVEMGAGGVLSRTIRRLAPHLACVELVVGPPDHGVLRQLGCLYRLGVRLDWDAYYEGRVIARIEAPTYPFEPVRCWCRPAGEPTGPAPGAVATGPSRPAPAATALDTERQVAQVWEQVLGAESVGPDGDYFAMGGTSIAGITVLRTLEESFGVRLTFTDLYAHPTVRQFAGRLAELAASAGDAGGSQVIKPVPRDGPLPLSFGQEQLWYLDQLNPGTPLYNIPHALRLDGPLDEAALDGAVRDLGARHEVLRSRIASDDGVPSVAIRAGDHQLQVIDLSAWPDASRDREAHRIVEEEAVRPFDLAAGPLARTTLVRLAPDDHLMLWTYHHIVFDGWSPTVFFRDFTELYRARVEGRAPRLPELAVQYADFAAWQRDQLSGDELERGLQFWRDELAGLERPELPLDRPRPPVRTYHGDLIPFTLDADLAGRVRQFSQRSGVTTFVTMLALVDALLHRWAGLTDVVVGVGTSGRVNRETHDLIGYFNNLPPFRTRVDGDLRFTDLVQRCAATVAKVLDHEEMPLEKIVAEVCRRRDPDRHPVFDVAYTYQNVPQETAELGGLSCSGYLESALGGIPPGTAKFDLTVGIVDQQEGPMEGYLEYAIALFDATTIRRLVDWLPALLDTVMRDPGQPLSCFAGPAPVSGPVPVSGPAPVTAPGPVPAAREPADPVRRFEEWAARRPDHPAIRGADGTTITYRELNRLSNRAARRLIDAGVGPDMCVPVVAERGPELVVGWLAVEKAGGAYVPIDTSAPKARVDALIADIMTADVTTAGASTAGATAGAAFVLPGGNLLAIGSAEGSPAIGSLAGGPLAECDDENPPGRAVPGNLAYVAHTSGSTGRPHGCQVDRSSLANVVDWYHAEAAITCDDRLLQCLSPGFDASVLEIWAALAGGGTICFLPTMLTEPGRLLSWMADRQVTVAFLPTPLAEIVLTEGEWPEGLLLRVLCTGGDRLRVRPPADAPFRVLNAYGPTECTVVSTIGHVDPSPPGETSPAGTMPDIGRPISGADVHLLDPRGARAPAGQWGEICVGGDGVGRGYFRSPGLTATRFVADPFSGRPGARMYRTGDLARWRADGTLEFGGRLDDQLEIRGQRVEPAEIEQALTAHPLVREAVVVAAASPAGSVRLVAHVAGEGPDPGELITWTAGLLPRHMVPGEIVVHDSLPRTPNGKLDRRSMQKMSSPSTVPFSARDIQGGGLGDGKTSRAERILAEICADLLAVEKVSPSDNFFELGGDSVLSVRVAARAAKAGIQFTPQQFLQCQTIGELAAITMVSEPATGPRAEQPGAEQPRVGRAVGVGRAVTEPAAAGAFRSPPAGPIPLTPIMHSLLAQIPDGAVELVEVQALETAPEVSADVARAAVRDLVALHEPLRYRLRQNDLGRYLECGDADLAGFFDAKTLPPLTAEEELAVIADDCAAMKARMDPERGPMLRVRYYDRGRIRGGLLMMIISHLAFDNMSIVVMLDDLDALLADNLAGRPSTVAPSPPQWREWSHYLRDMAVSDELAAELTYWTATLRAGAATGEISGAGGGGIASRAIDSPGVVAAFTASAARGREAATCAAAVGLARWQGTPSAYVMTEGEATPNVFRRGGRGPSVGWFTSLHPLVLDVTPGASARDSVPGAVDRMRSVPNDGVGYGMLRYLAPDSPAVSRLRSLPEPQAAVLHGPSDAAAFDSGVGLLRTRWDLAVNLKRAAGSWFPVIIASAVRDGALRMSVASSSWLDQRQLEALADEIAQASTELGASTEPGAAGTELKTGTELRAATEPAG
jgi:amino acid adenylation domain-containing protein/non-ribosomal peptide synthase protein (TIGR01720 family)